jgi:hypothetical protein
MCWRRRAGVFRLLWVDPAQVKALPGKKTDPRDAKRICGYLQQGLLRGSLAPGANSGNGAS